MAASARNGVVGDTLVSTRLVATALVAAPRGNATWLVPINHFSAHPCYRNWAPGVVVDFCRRGARAEQAADV